MITPADLPLPTPCADWDLRTLLAHMIGQNHGFAAAAEDGDAPASAFAPQPSDPADVLADWATSSDRLVAAFATAVSPMRMAEFGTDQRFPVAAVVGFHLIDTVIHAWDVATTLGRDYRPDDDLVDASLHIAQQIPGGEIRETPGAPFGPIVASDGDDWVTTLAWLGRPAAPEPRG